MEKLKMTGKLFENGKRKGNRNSQPEGKKAGRIRGFFFNEKTAKIFSILYIS